MSTSDSDLSTPSVVMETARSWRMRAIGAYQVRIADVLDAAAAQIEALTAAWHSERDARIADNARYCDRIGVIEADRDELRAKLFEMGRLAGDAGNSIARLAAEKEAALAQLALARPIADTVSAEAWFTAHACAVCDLHGCHTPDCPVPAWIAVRK